MTDQRMELIIANLLRTGVTLAAAVVFTGGVGYLIHHGGEQPAYRTFHGGDSPYRTVAGILTRVAHLDALALIQLGLLFLIATPIARVVFALLGFGLEKDRMYMIITSIVLVVLVYGVFIAR